jgi:hypothetical protein
MARRLKIGEWVESSPWEFGKVYEISDIEREDMPKTRFITVRLYAQSGRPLGLSSLNEDGWKRTRRRPTAPKAEEQANASKE